jgi:beta-fructofuranosidase
VTISLQQNPFFAPPGGALGDTFPFFYRGECHLFVLQPPHIAHFVSHDYVHWEVKPIAIPLGAVGEPDADGMIATGVVVEHEGRFHMFYAAGGSQTICLATSTDLDNWTKHAGNPILVGDGELYARDYFRDPYVFFNEAEGCWWMLLGSRVTQRPGARAGCVGLAKSSDLLHWELCAPLWAPGIGPHHDCPQLVEANGRWYLFYLQRNTRYRVADAPSGPFERPVSRDVGTMYAAAGSRPVFDGARWITFPFMISLTDQRDDGDWRYGGPLTVPRELLITGDGEILERPLSEVVQALNELPACVLEADPIIGAWDTSEPGRAVCASDAGGTLILNDAPGALFFEADVVLTKREMEAHILLRAAADLSAGYKLGLHPGENVVDIRHISSSDIDRVLVSKPTALPLDTLINIKVFLAGSMMDVFINDCVSVTTRAYERREGALILEFRDAVGEFRNVRVRPLRENEFAM